MRRPKPLNLILRVIALVIILSAFYYVACSISRVAGAL
jgi:hypothetical protein